MTASIGWVATAAFAASYLCKNPGALRRVQALAACLWILYGCVVGALPVVVANLIVAVMAVVYPWFRVRLASRRASSASVADAASRESFRPAAEMHRAINQAHIPHSNPYVILPPLPGCRAQLRIPARR
ncbi:MAG: hypothetical protein JO295_00180 [Verrucomicrobia bacterium]|nr:hypothetical protein [Verrucomicrobiota bacterium]